jgi:hypothetical protein
VFSPKKDLGNYFIFELLITNQFIWLVESVAIGGEVTDQKAKLKTHWDYENQCKNSQRIF